MDKKSALILSLLVTTFLANLYLIYSYYSADNYKTAIIRVIDGDTVELTGGITARLVNINAPEKNTIGANLSKIFLDSFLNSSLGAEVLGKDKYNRALVRLYNSEYINLKLVELGLTSKFLVQQEELVTFEEAEKEAVRKGIGIWQHSPFYGCVLTDIDKKKEVVKFNIVCPNISMENWYVKDESRKTFQFPKIINDRFLLHSGIGIPNSTDLFWNSKDDIWNNDADAFYLFDNNGKIVQYETYH